MPNLISLHVSILESVQTNDYKDQYTKPNNRNNCLNNLTLRLHDPVSTDELMPLFTQYCSNVKKLIIYLNPAHEYSSNHERPDVRFVNLRQWITTTVNPLMPQLTSFHLRQHIHSRYYDLLSRPCNPPPYIEEMPCSLEHRSYRVHVSSHLKSSWTNIG
jgi:hypothetical protein